MKETIYFSVTPKLAGFSDQLLEFSYLYKLGLSLGYTYWHQPFISPRSSGKSLPTRLENQLNKWSRKLPFLQKIVNLRKAFNVYDFLGFNDYFLAENAMEDILGARNLDLVFSEDFPPARETKTLTDLQAFVKRFVAEKTEPGQKVLLNFGLKGRWPAWQMILESIPQFPDGLDLRRIYFQKRAAQPWPLVFPDGQIKSMIHIRQGDTALLPTPWNTFITLWPAQYEFEEYAQIEEMPLSHRVLLVEDYALFYRQFINHMPDSLATLVFSDGFARSLHKLKRRIEQFNFSREQVQTLYNAVRSFDDTQFKVFEEFDHCRLFIGEEADNLCHLIHSFMTADLVIIGSQQWMFPKLVALFCTRENMPLMIVLSKADEDEVWHYDGLNLGDRLEKFIFVNLEKPDFAGIAARIEDHLNVLHR